MKIPQANLPKVAVLRGGNVKRETSLSEGALLLSSLSKIGYEPYDVLIEEDGTWVHRGIPTDPHAVFTRVDGYVDTTRTNKEIYHDLASRMGIPDVLRGHELPHDEDSETTFRILRQAGIAVPETAVIRARGAVVDEHLYDLWRTMHTPLLVRSLSPQRSESAKLVRSLKTLRDTINSFLEKQEDVHILTYTDVPTYSIAVLPAYRGEPYYTPFPVFTKGTKGEVPHGASNLYGYTDGSPEDRMHIASLAQEVAKALSVATPVTVDIIKDKDVYKVVRVDVAPSLRPEGRFLSSLATTGVDIGHYIHSKLFI